jgi:hypothetical protein
MLFNPQFAKLFEINYFGNLEVMGGEDVLHTSDYAALIGATQQQYICESS